VPRWLMKNSIFGQKITDKQTTAAVRAGGARSATAGRGTRAQNTRQNLAGGSTEGKRRQRRGGALGVITTKGGDMTHFGEVGVGRGRLVRQKIQQQQQEAEAEEERLLEDFFSAVGDVYLSPRLFD
jgi:hypothetical protein